MVRQYIITALLGYLCGSIPFGYLLVRIFRGKDIRASGSGNIGATNVARTAPGLGIATLVLDAAKGYLAVMAATFFVPGYYSDVLESLWGSYNDADPSLAFAALFAVLGHMFPVWLKFRGGKGVATAVGALAYVAPIALFVSLVIFLLVVAITRYVSLGSVLGALAFPGALRILRPDFPWPAIAITGIISILIVLKHHENFRRLLAGTENRFTLKRKVAAVQLANED